MEFLIMHLRQVLRVQSFVQMLDDVIRFRGGRLNSHSRKQRRALPSPSPYTVTPQSRLTEMLLVFLHLCIIRIL